jgi:hypothetical protein
MKKFLSLLFLVIIVTSCASTKYSPKKMGSDACPNHKPKKLRAY